MTNFKKENKKRGNLWRQADLASPNSQWSGNSSHKLNNICCLTKKPLRCAFIFCEMKQNYTLQDLQFKRKNCGFIEVKSEANEHEKNIKISAL